MTCLGGAQRVTSIAGTSAKKRAARDCPGLITGSPQLAALRSGIALVPEAPNT